MINKKYTLFIRIPIYKSKDGRIFCEKMWAQDLFMHLQYIENFSLCCPVLNADHFDELTDITDWNIKNIYPLFMDNNFHGIFKNLHTIFRAVRNSEIVHSDAAGWPFPLSFYVLLARLFLFRKWIVVVESSFWMSTISHSRLKGVIKFQIFDLLLKFVVRKADARVFTSSFYKNYFLGESDERCLIYPAIWLHKDDILSREKVFGRIDSRGLDHRLKVVFPSRLVPEKGALILIDAISILKKKCVPIDICIIGDGSLKSDFMDLSIQDLGSVSVSFMSPVEYGPNFFAILSNFDYVLLCNTNEEQPRIVFDAFSQGLPVVAPKTTGIIDIVNSQNSILYEIGSPESLAEALASLPISAEFFKMAADAALQTISGRSHRAMHEAREVFLRQIL